MNNMFSSFFVTFEEFDLKIIVDDIGDLAFLFDVSVSEIVRLLVNPDEAFAYGIRIIIPADDDEEEEVNEEDEMDCPWVTRAEAEAYQTPLQHCWRAFAAVSLVDKFRESGRNVNPAIVKYSQIFGIEPHILQMVS